MTGDLTYGILAGGASRRMGRDKAMLSLDGASFLERILAVGRSRFQRVVVVGRVVEKELDAEWLQDECPGAGPLAALATLLRGVGGDVIVAACDMPLIEVSHVDWLVGEWRRAQGGPGLVPESDLGLEPTFAIYGYSLLESIDRLIASGERSLQKFVQDARIPTVAIPARLMHGLANINTIDDYSRLVG